jgi:hypothetical protein
MNTPLRYYSNTLRAAVGGAGIPVRVDLSDADFYRFLSIPEGVEVSINDGPFIPLYLIPSYQRKPNEEALRVVTLINTTTQVLVYRLVAGLGALPPSFENEVKEPRTEAVGWSGTSVAAGVSVNFVPLLSGMRTRRKAIIVNNRDTSADLLLRDASNNVVGVISGGEKQIFPISETVNLYNAGGAAVACAVGEIYWLG